LIQHDRVKVDATVGSPTKFSFDRTLNLASLRRAVTKYKAPIQGNPKWVSIKAGKTPNETISAKESRSLPSLLLPNLFAINPSIPSIKVEKYIKFKI